MERAQFAALLRNAHEDGCHLRFHAACPTCHEALRPSLDRVMATWAAWRGQSARTSGSEPA